MMRTNLSRQHGVVLCDATMIRLKIQASPVFGFPYQSERDSVNQSRPKYILYYKIHEVGMNCSFSLSRFVSSWRTRSLLQTNFSLDICSTSMQSSTPAVRLELFTETYSART